MLIGFIRFIRFIRFTSGQADQGKAQIVQMHGGGPSVIKAVARIMKI